MRGGSGSETPSSRGRKVEGSAEFKGVGEGGEDGARTIEWSVKAAMEL